MTEMTKPNTPTPEGTAALSGDDIAALDAMAYIQRDVAALPLPVGPAGELLVVWTGFREC
jgi:hypothetical protein